ncbi:hypothetical protein [Desulfovibrio falkowii]|uniref:hypothetical protein n=1 Tax=Desulfovibrio falkowii TaxID=3136602 RepID=UPI0038B274CB
MPQPLRTFTYYVAYANYLIMVLMLVIVRVFLLMVPALAVGTVAFADVLFLLLYKHTIAVNRHNKTGFSFKNNSLCAETTKDQRILKCADGRRDRLVHLAHVNKNTFAVHMIDAQKINDSISLVRAELVIEANVKIILTEAVGNVRNRCRITIINHTLPPLYVIAWRTFA